jgi:hypothetical protein
MAFTVTTTKKTVFGDERVHHMTVVADATTQTVATGLTILESIAVAHKSATSGMGKWKINVGAEGTATAGSFAVTSVVSGDEYYVTVFGR